MMKIYVFVHIILSCFKHKPMLHILYLYKSERNERDRLTIKGE